MRSARAWKSGGGTLCTIAAILARLAARHSRLVLIGSWFAISTRLIARTVIVRARRTQGRKSGSNRTEGPLWADDALINARHHIERHILVRASRTWKSGGGAGGAVVALTTGIARCRALSLLIASRGAFGANSRTHIRIEGAWSAKSMFPRAGRACRTDGACSTIVGVSEVGLIAVRARQTWKLRRRSFRAEIARGAVLAIRRSALILVGAAFTRSAFGMTGCRRVRARRTWRWLRRASRA